MEEIQIFDSINNKSVNVYVAQEIAERCRLDATFAAELVKQIEDQNVEEGSTVEIETVADIGSSSDAFTEKESWSRKETLKFLKLYQKYESKYATNKKTFWTIISNELARRNIIKPSERCRSKWKNLMRTYKAAKERNYVSRFQYFKAVDDLQNGKLLVLSDSNSGSEVESCDERDIFLDAEMEKLKDVTEKESWSKYETVKFLKCFQRNKYKVDNKDCSREQLWKQTSLDLLKDGIYKTPEKCATKWKNLHRTYKKIISKDRNTQGQRFKYFKQVDNLLHDREISSDRSSSSDAQEDSEIFENGDDFPVKIEFTLKDEYESDKEMMTNQNELSKCLWAYNKHQNKLKTFQDEADFWRLISEELKSVGVHKEPSECKKVCSNYKESDINGKGDDKMEIMDDIGRVHTIEESQGEDSDNFERNQGNYEKIIIETEDADAGTSWSDDEVAKLISLCAKHIKTNKTKELDYPVWEVISTTMTGSGRHKSPEKCKTKWNELYSTYETSTKFDLDCKNFAIFEEIEQMFKESAGTSDHTNTCKCNERHLLDKQRRHAERMQILKRKLDIEERKIKAFEEYVKYIKR